MFFESIAAYLNAAQRGSVAKKIFIARCSKAAILAFLKSFKKPFKSQPLKLR